MPLPARDQTQCSRDAGEWPGVRPRAPDRRPYVDHGQDGAHVGLALGVADVVPAEPDGVLGMPLVIERWRCRTEVHEPERGRHRCSAPFHGNDRGRKSMPGPGPGAPVPRVRARSRTEVETRSARACSRGGCAGTSRTSSRGSSPAPVGRCADQAEQQPSPGGEYCRGAQHRLSPTWAIHGTSLREAARSSVSSRASLRSSSGTGSATGRRQASAAGTRTSAGCAGSAQRARAQAPVPVPVPVGRPARARIEPSQLTSG